MQLHISIDAEITGDYVRDDIVEMLENVLGYMTDNVAISSTIEESPHYVRRDGEWVEVSD